MIEGSGGFAVCGEMRCWDACLLARFARVLGGHVFPGRLGPRLRRFPARSGEPIARCIESLATRSTEKDWILMLLSSRSGPQSCWNCWNLKAPQLLTPEPFRKVCAHDAISLSTTQVHSSQESLPRESKHHHEIS